MTKKLKKIMAHGVSAKRLKVGTWLNVTTVPVELNWRFHLDCDCMTEIPIGFVQIVKTTLFAST